MSLNKLWENWAIDAGLSYPQDNIYCFVPVKGNIKGECSFVTGMNYIGDSCPGKLVAIIHPEGQKAADEWYEENKQLVQNIRNTEQE
jgi:hypothetical protein